MRLLLARVALAGVAATAAWVGIELLNTADEGSGRTEELQRHLEATPPASADQVAQLTDRVVELPTSIPTPRIVVTAAPGPAGPPGQAGSRGPQGASGSTTVRTVTVPARGAPQAAQRPARPSPAPTVTVTAAPHCVAYLAGLCLTR